ncbi:hypothetical protein ACVGVM_23545 [Pseudonocardia bannensis]|uniref:Uncharacterized protein n=1 Tax=Pseudonocardia bannensis TaxID=630973 RepID=A0A848DKY2_9PSEU|nr:hypothetical protein [Pseudonocardia bannensis]NMH93410.1 hypothetical protein [Pseudonocardia bannensis]
MLLWLWPVPLPRHSPQELAGTRGWIGRYFRRPPDLRGLMLCRAAAATSDVLLLGAVITLLQIEPVVAAVLGILGLIVSVQAATMRADYRRHLDEALPRPTDREVDAALAGHLLDIENRALTVLGLRPADIVATGTTWNPIADLEHRPHRNGERDYRPLIVVTPMVTTRSAIGSDGVWRFAAQEVTVICPTEYHVAVFRCEQDLITGKRRGEQTQEFFYRDVVSVLTANLPGPDLTSEPFDHRSEGRVPISPPGRRELQFAAPSTDRTMVAVGVTGRSSGARIRDSGIDAAIEGVRNLLRVMRRPPDSVRTAPGRAERPAQ